LIFLYRKLLKVPLVILAQQVRQVTLAQRVQLVMPGQLDRQDLARQ